MPYDSRQMRIVAQINALLDTLESKTVISKEEMDKLKRGEKTR